MHVAADGTATPTAIVDPVRALLRDRAGWLWIATRGGLIARRTGGELEHIATARGCELVDTRALVEAPGDHVLAIGSDDQGRERVAIGQGLAWTTYRTLPNVAWDAAARRGAGVVVMGGGRVYRIVPGGGAVRPLARDGIRLVPVLGTGEDWAIDPVDVVVPPGATTLASADDQLLIGTRELGTARYHEGDAQPRGWLRRSAMFADATRLSVACVRADDCWIATGTRGAWRWNGERFSAAGPDELVLAVARDPSGAIYAVHRARDEGELHVSRIDGAGWTPLTQLVLETSGGAPEIGFARFASQGQLWLGLSSRDGGERRAAGVAVVDVAAGKVTYPRADVPDGVTTGDLRGGVGWLASDDGVVRIARGRVQQWSEPSGGRAIAIGHDGTPYVATARGVVAWDGKRWSVPPALHFDVHDVVATQGGQVWMATARGLAAWDGDKLRRVDVRRGLAEDQVLDVAVDQFDRVWARGPASLTLISQ
jgi:ligand-binding sensor domain-containing protein